MISIFFFVIDGVDFNLIRPKLMDLATAKV
jgi:hypothetical protein